MINIHIFTFVLQSEHLLVLEDWLRFFDCTPKTIVAHIGRDPSIRRNLEALCIKYNVGLCIVGFTTVSAATNEELSLLREQFAFISDDEYACIIKLDTLPWRNEHYAWQCQAFKELEEQGALFITGATLPFRADERCIDPSLLLTQRVSNCFLIVNKNVWQYVLGGVDERSSVYGRFCAEGEFEDYLNRERKFGVRLINTVHLRIFHCQEWGPRLKLVREKFRKGAGVSNYMSGFQDDFMGENSRYYMKKGPGFLKRTRSLLGSWRRRVFARCQNFF